MRVPLLRSLRGRLVFLVLLAAVPALLLASYTGLELRGHAKAEAHEEAGRLARLVSASQNQALRDIHQLLTVIAGLAEVDDRGSPPCSERLARLLEENPRYVNLGVIDPDGFCRCSARPFSSSVDLRNRPYFQRAVQTTNIAVGVEQDLAEATHYSLSFGYPVLTKTGELRGVAFAVLDLSWPNQLANRAWLPPGTTVRLLDQGGLVLSSYPDAVPWVGMPALESSLLATYLARRMDGAVEHRDPDGIRRVYAFAPLTGSWRYGGAYLSIGIPAKIAYAQANWITGRNMALLGIVSLLALAAAWWGAGPLMVRPLEALASVSQRLAAGDLTARTRWPDGVGEIQRVARAFNRMAEALQLRAEERRRVAEALQRSETRLRDVFENSPDAIVVADLDGAILEVNPAACRLQGMLRDRIVGRNLVDFLPEEMRPAGVRALYRLVLGKWREDQTFSVHADGHHIPVEIRARRIDYLGAPALLLHVRDITERKQAEVSLARERDLLYALMDNIPDLVYFKDSASRFIRINQAHARALGLQSPRQAQGRTDFDFFGPEHARSTRADEEKIMQTAEPLIGKIEHLRLGDGHVRYLSATKAPIRDRAGQVTGVVGISRDITELKLTEAALRDAYQFNEEIIFNTGQGLVVHDRAYRYLVWNPFMEHLTGLSAAEALGKSALDVFPEWRTQGVDALLAGALAGKTTKSPDIRFVHPQTGKSGWLQVTFTPLRDFEGTIIGVIGDLTDITQRKLAEEALRESEARYRLLFDSNPHPMWVHDLETLQFLAVNEAAIRHYAYSREEFFALSVEQLLAPHPPPQWLRSLRQERAEPAATDICQHRRKDGSLIDVEVTAHPIVYAGRRAAVVLVNDITERERAQEALRDTNRRLEEALAELQQTQQHIIQQERLRALGQVASGIAHDFNNALAPILGFTELLLVRPENLRDEEKAARYLKVVHTAARDAANVVGRLREFYRSREQHEVFAPVDLNETVRELVSLTQPKWKDQALASGVSISVETDLNRIPPVAGNEAELREALTNLIFNAVDAMLPLRRPGAITLRTRSSRDSVILEVSDTGSGMTAEVLQHCLEPFFSTKGELGTGLGLSVVYGVVKRHGGVTEIVSEVGKGTTFLITLPAVEGQTVSRSQRTPVPCVRPLNILLVDDEPLVREIEAEYLTGDGHRVDTASGGREALDKLAGRSFDLVVTDRGMPGMNGDQLAAEIKDRRGHLPVILLTGFGVMMQAAGEMPAGVDCILCKPVALEELREAIGRLANGAAPVHDTTTAHLPHETMPAVP